MLDTAKLRQVLAIRDNGSFARAAEALGLTQPTLSKSIARLEDKMKVRIFHRTARGSELTPVGEMIAERAARVIAESENLVRDVSLVSGGDAGKIRLGVGSALGRDFLELFVVHLAREFPNLRAHIELGQSTNLLSLLARRELDLIFTVFSPDIDNEQFYFEDIARYETVIVARNDHPLAGRKISIAELSGFKAIGAEGPYSNKALLGGSAEDLVSFYTVNSYRVAIPMVSAGLATLLCPRVAVADLLSSGELAELDVGQELPSLRFGATVTRAASHAPVLKRLISEARHIARCFETPG
jgi:DNA-binding transcriptional LysR family regulator